MWLGSLEGALDYLKSHRNVEPGLYNEGRLNEQPIPENDGRDHDDNDASDENENADNAIEEILIPANDDVPVMNGNDEVVETAENNIDPINTSSNGNAGHIIEEILIGNGQNSDGGLNNTGNNGNGSNVAESAVESNVIGDEIEIEANNSNDNENANRAGYVGDQKQHLVPVYEICTANREAMLLQLEDRSVHVVDDMEITVGSKGFGRPLNVTVDGLLKREARDEISGEIPFNEKVGKHFRKRVTHFKYYSFNVVS